MVAGESPSRRGRRLNTQQQMQECIESPDHEGSRTHQGRKRRKPVSNEKRAYHSPLRQRRAAESRQRIIDSAAALFDDRGYAGTTMAAIASKAKVSVESVHGVGQKNELLLLAFHRVFDDNLVDPSWLEQLDENADSEKAQAEWISAHVDANARAAGLWMAVRAAAAVEPSVADAFQAFLESRRSFYAAVIRWISSAGLMTEPIDDRMDDYAGALAVLFSPETYYQLVRDWGFDRNRYEGWLRRALSNMDSSDASRVATS